MGGKRTLAAIFPLHLVGNRKEEVADPFCDDVQKVIISGQDRGPTELDFIR